jgi:asparagine synthase (glutamine-hydrolysing)
MAGIAGGYRGAAPEDIHRMLDAMSHRGPAWRGVVERNSALLGQNYAAADITSPTDADKTGDKARLGNLGWGDDGPAVLYDGQIGNGSELARQHGVAEGPRRDERLLLQLYHRHGVNLFSYLDDAVFSMAICDGDRLLVARDLLGIKTLFYGRKNGTLYFGSELKSILAIADEVHEFPPGHFMDSDGRLTPFARLTAPAQGVDDSPEQAAETIRDIVWRSVCNRVDFAPVTAGLLSGGLDSSVVCCLAVRRLKEQFGSQARLKTFAVGLGESEDIRQARIVAEHLGTDHHELIVDLAQVIRALPDVIGHLESFDPSLVRSSVANYLISQYARQHGIQQLLSGEGGDEVFCGYLYLKQFPPEQLAAEQLKCLGYLHSNAALRLDRMNQCHSVRVVTPLISGELLNYALRLPAEYKLKPEGDGKIEKWIFRKAYEELLPAAIVWRVKQEFSQGSGAADVLPAYFDALVDDGEFADAQREHPQVRSKEEWYYFRLFTERFGKGSAVATVGQWVTL